MTVETKLSLFFKRSQNCTSCKTLEWAEKIFFNFRKSSSLIVGYWYKNNFKNKKVEGLIMDCRRLNLLATLFLRYNKIIKPSHSEAFSLDAIASENLSGVFVLPSRIINM